MSIVFVAGSRQTFRLPAEVRSRLDTMIENGFQILVGDANGADKRTTAGTMSELADA